ncbi:MAG TPA: nuclear transport factor 2 family protein [Pyrinomonadaceae bacterium]|jgi:ketosteroid isomerase-like protein
MKDNVQIIQDCYDNFGEGNIAGILAKCTEKVDWTIPEIENATFGGNRQGRDEVSEFFSRMDAEEEVLTFEPKEFIAQGDRVVALGKYAAQVRETGRIYETDWVHVFTVKDGKITSFQEFFDNAAASRAFQKAATA